MHTSILTIGILLLSQVGAPGDRYAPVVPPGSASELGAPPSSLQQTASPGISGSGELTDSASAGSLSQQPANPLRTNSLAPAGRPAATVAPTDNGSRAVSTPPAAPTSRLTKVAKPVDLLQSLAKPLSNQQLQGRPLSLSQALQTATSRPEQARRVTHYWQLSRATTDYRLAVLELIQLQSQRNGLLQPGHEWLAAEQAASARAKTARIAFQTAQVRLQKMFGESDGVSSPIPTDLPHCGAYQTKYAQIFRGRSAPEAEQLTELLSMRHQQLGQAAADTAAAQQWLRQVSQQRSARDDASLLLKAYEQLSLQRRIFVEAVYRYNGDIARYTRLAVPQVVDNVRLAGMLIQSPLASEGWQTGSIRRASAEESAARATSVDRYKPKTSSKNSTQPRKPSSPPIGSERSILVGP